MAPSRAALVRRVRAMESREDLEDLLPHSKPLSWFRPGRKIAVADKMQSRYSYTLTEPVGKNFAPGFRPALTPAQMLRRGVFEGKYLNDCVLEFPREWYAKAMKRLSPSRPDASLNEFGIKSRKSLKYWRKKGWIPIVKGGKDVRGWFQWYCRYYIGRRDPKVDEAQIARWKSFKRHEGQIKASYERAKSRPRSRAAKKKHRPRQRQALLQWAYDPYV